MKIWCNINKALTTQNKTGTFKNFYLYELNFQSKSTQFKSCESDLFTQNLINKSNESYKKIHNFNAFLNKLLKSELLFVPNAEQLHFYCCLHFSEIAFEPSNKLWLRT